MSNEMRDEMRGIDNSIYCAKTHLDIAQAAIRLARKMERVGGWGDSSSASTALGQIRSITEASVSAAEYELRSVKGR